MSFLKDVFYIYLTIETISHFYKLMQGVERMKPETYNSDHWMAGGTANGCEEEKPVFNMRRCFIKK
uniref:Uncharacterized protein n=1 Tax=Thermosporothrix sp. COM3 TaxID=2490863 RepID=A0A455SG96_9CHLR|nr:hypothetical protein KTC_07830 [Thermosporothrix sp. COM3]